MGGICIYKSPIHIPYLIPVKYKGNYDPGSNKNMILALAKPAYRKISPYIGMSQINTTSGIITINIGKQVNIWVGMSYLLYPANIGSFLLLYIPLNLRITLFNGLKAGKAGKGMGIEGIGVLNQRELGGEVKIPALENSANFSPLTISHKYFPILNPIYKFLFPIYKNPLIQCTCKCFFSNFPLYKKKLISQYNKYKLGGLYYGW